MLYVVATYILPDGSETDALFVEEAENIGEGCVALTAAMSQAAAKELYIEMKAERDRENPNWYHAITTYGISR